MSMNLPLTPRADHESDENDDNAETSKKLLSLLHHDADASRLFFSRFLSPSRGSLEIGLDSIIKLDLPNCNLSETDLPSTLPGALPNLERIFFFKNAFKVYPAILGECPKLKMVSFKSNLITRIEDDGMVEQLEWLILTDNKLRELPDSIGNCVNMRKLMLAGNSLASLPTTISNLTNLELVRLACNDLSSPPMELLRLPNLKWVALGSNPFTERVAPPKVPKPREIDPSEIELGEVLGSGASGTTMKGSWNGRDVAVKKYKGSITSDGSPRNELAVNLCVGTLDCEGLVKVEGVCRGDLVMGLLEGYGAIGGPPNFDTCTRDVYKDGLSVGADQGERVINEVGEALRLLHQRGVCHGDLYGHNILVKKNVGPGEDEGCFMTDFGAAFFYDRQEEWGRLVETIELRAFQVFVSEMCSLIYVRERDYYDEMIAEYMEDYAVTCEEVAECRGGFDRVTPRVYKAKPEKFKSWPRRCRVTVGYFTVMMFTATFLSVPMLSIFLYRGCWSSFEARMLSTLVLASYAVSMMSKQKEWVAFRDIGQLWYDVFNFKFTTSPRELRRKVKSGQSSGVRYVMAMHPHGIVPIHAVLWSAFCNQYMTDGVTGEGLYGFGAAADVVSVIPFLRNVMGWLSAGSASFDVLKRGLMHGDCSAVNLNGGRRPQHLFLLPGGVAEVFESTVGKHSIIFKRRRGLIRLSLECKTRVMPCYVFGGTDFYHNLITGESAAAKSARKMKMGITFFWGWLGSPFLPFRPDITICVGDEVDCSGGGVVEDKHKEYLDNLEGVFNKYKVVTGYEEEVLEIK